MTPKTLRRKLPLPCSDEQKREITRYDEDFQNQYSLMTTEYFKIEEKIKSYEKSLDHIEKYFNISKQALSHKFFNVKEANKKMQELKKYKLSNGAINAIQSGEIADEIVFLQIFQFRQNSDIVDLSFNLLYPIVRHYGIEGKNISYMIGHGIKSGELHPIEENAFAKALDYLLTTPDAMNLLELAEANASTFPDNAVLVSFLKRSDDPLVNDHKMICKDATSKDTVETHTIVLWKTKEKEITVIDPSKVDYSKDIVKALNNKNKPFHNFKFILEQESSNIDRIQGKIYQPEHMKNKKLARDCTDIAVKIAFELNERQLSCIEAKLTIEQISNIQKNFKDSESTEDILEFTIEQISNIKTSLKGSEIIARVLKPTIEQILNIKTSLKGSESTEGILKFTIEQISNIKTSLKGSNIINDILKSTIKQLSNVTLPKEIGSFKSLQSSDPELRAKAKELVEILPEEILKSLDISTIDSTDLNISTIDTIGKLNSLIDIIGELSGIDSPAEDTIL